MPAQARPWSIARRSSTCCFSLVVTGFGMPVVRVVDVLTPLVVRLVAGTDLAGKAEAVQAHYAARVTTSASVVVSWPPS